MGFYSRYLLPTIVSCGCSLPPITELRQWLVPRATGTVLELGFGSGLNLPLYQQNKVSRIYGLEPDAAMLKKAQRRVAQSPVPVSVLQERAETLSLADQSIDTVLVTFTLCTVPDVATALRAARRVLKPQGQLLFCEHGRSPDAEIFNRQMRIEPLWKKIFGGCHLTRDIPTLIKQAGFAINDLDANYMLNRGPNIGGYIYRGSASVLNA